MSRKPPASPSVKTPEVSDEKGQEVEKQETPQTPPPPVAVYPSGDVVLETQEFMLGAVPQRHAISIIERTDPSQFYRFLMKCSCGGEARSRTEGDIRKAADSHVKARNL
jgi:hypothetical protein